VPSPHRRIGLVVDEPVDSILRLFRDGAEPALPEARIARLAILEGALVEALLKVATGEGNDRGRAAELVGQVRDMLPSLPLSGQIKDELLDVLRRAEARPSLPERRRRQLELLRRSSAPSGGQTAQDLADTFDAFERVPVR